MPGATVLRGRQARPWLVQSPTADAAILTDLAGGVIHVALSAPHPDEVEPPSVSPAPGGPSDLTS